MEGWSEERAALFDDSSQAMAVSLVFLVYPILYMFKLGFYKWNMVGEMKFIGLDNYVSLMNRSGVYAGAEKYLSVFFLDSGRCYTGECFVFIL